MSPPCAKCTITKKGEVIKEFKQFPDFPKDGLLTDYNNVLSNLQAEINQALTDLVEEEAKEPDTNPPGPIPEDNEEDEVNVDEEEQERNEENVMDKPTGDNPPTEPEAKSPKRPATAKGNRSKRRRRK